MPTNSPEPATITSDLVRRAQAGDAEAFSQIVRRYQDMAVGYARSQLGSFDLAEDVAQEAFLEAHRKLGALRDPEKFAAWLRTIVFTQCDRMTRRAALPTITIEAAIHVPSAEAEPGFDLEQRESRREVHMAIAALPDVERSAVVLFYIGGCSQREIALFLGVTPNTVKTRLYSARRRLQERILPLLQKDLHENRPSRDDQFADRVIRSALPVQIYAIDDATRTVQVVGTTAGLRTAARPNARVWFLKPTGDVAEHDWDKILDLLEEHAIPGLEVTETFGDRQLRRVARLGNLRYLDLNNSQVTNAGLQALASFPDLEHLRISGCRQVTDDGLAILRQTPRLTHFHADHHPTISDAGIAWLSDHGALENVTLPGTRTGDGALAALTGKPNLSHISLGSEVTDNGLAHLRDFPALHTWRDGVPAMDLLSNDAQPSFVMINLKAPVTDAGLAHLADLDGLYAVNLFGTSGSATFDDSASTISTKGIAHLTRMANLGWLGCCATKCTDEVMAQIGQMPRLRFLMCQDTVAGDDGFEALAASQTIEQIWGRRCYNLGDRGFGALAQMPALRNLAVSCRNVGDAGLSSLPTFQALRELMPIDVPDAGFAHIGRCTGLEVLDNMYCPDTTDAATDQIRALALKSYRVWGTKITDRSLEIMGSMPSLERLLFYKCGITDAGLTRIAKLPNLREIALESLDGITEAGVGCFPANVQVKYEPG